MKIINISVLIILLQMIIIHLHAQGFTDNEQQKAKMYILDMYHKPLPDSAKDLSLDSILLLTDKYTFLISRSARDKWFYPSKKDHARVGFTYHHDSTNFIVTNIVFEGSAYSSGLVKGNCIQAVNGRNPSTVEEFSYMLKGDSGTSFVLTVQEYHTGNIVDIKIKKDYLEKPKILYERIGKSAIIRLEDFHENIHNQFVSISQSLIPESIDTLILDVRDNPGGYIDEAIKIISEFLPPEIPVLRNKYKNDSDTLMSYGSHYGIWTHLKKVYVLTDSESASASELLAGVLMKLCKNTEIIGDTTFGKGLMQKAFPLFPKGAYLHLTVAEFYPGLDLKVDKVGVIPARKLKRITKVPIPSNAEILKIREEYTLPSTKAFEDDRLNGKEYLAEYIWGLRGQLYAILAVGTFR